MAVAGDGWHDLEEVRQDLGAQLGERGDLVAVKAAKVGDAVQEGERPDRTDMETLREAMDEIARALQQVEEIDEAAEGGTYPERE